MQHIVYYEVIQHTAHYDYNREKVKSDDAIIIVSFPAGSPSFCPIFTIILL